MSTITRNRTDLLWVALAGALALLIASLPVQLTVALLAGSFLLCAFWLEPELALITTLGLAPLKSLLETEASFSHDIGQMGLGLFLAIWLLRRISSGDKRFQFEWRVIVPVALFTVCAAVSLWTSYSTVNTIKELVKWLEILAFVVVIPNTRRPDWIIFGLILSATLQAVIGIWEFLGGSGAGHLWILDYRFFRGFGTFGQPNPFGGFMGMILPLGLGLAVGHLWEAYLSAGKRSSLLPIGVLYGAASVTIFGGLLSSWSRGAWLGFMAAGVVMIWSFPRQRKYGTLALGASLLLVIVLWVGGGLPTSVSQRLTGFTTDFAGLEDVRGADVNDDNYAVLERLAHWQAALNMAEAKPWTGIGFSNYETAYREFGLPRWPEALGHAHNYYLNLLAETGIIGLSGYVIMWMVIVVVTLRLLNTDLLDWHERGIAVGLLGSWTHIMVHSFLDKLYVNNLFLHVGVMLGILATLTMKKIEKEELKG